MIVHQTKYLTDVLKRLGIENCKAIATPQEQNTVLIENEGNPVNKQEYQALIGTLTFAVTRNRPGIAQALGSVNQFLSNPSQAH